MCLDPFSCVLLPLMLTSLLFFYIQPGARHEAQLCRTSATTVRAKSRGRLPTYRVTVIYPPPSFHPGWWSVGHVEHPEITFTPKCCIDLSCASSPTSPSPTTSPPSSRPSRFTPPAPLPPLPCPHPEACVWCCGHFLHRLSRQPGGVICHERSSDLLFEVVVGSYLCRVSATAKISSPLCGLSALTDWLG